MRLRALGAADRQRLEEMHRAMGLAYELPELGGQNQVAALGFEDDAGELVMALLARITSEAYLLMDREAGTPLERWQRFLVLHEAGRRAGVAAGLEDVSIWCPPELERTFGRRLKRLGWLRNKWPTYTLGLKG